MSEFSAITTTKNQAKRKEKTFIFLMMLFPVIHWCIFWLYVNFSSIALAFQDTRTGILTWDNFKAVGESLTSPYGEIRLALKNTLLYFGTSLLIISPCGLLMSYFLFKRIVGNQAFRIIFYLPAIISGVVMVTCYTTFIDPHGPLGNILNWFNVTIPPEGWLARKETATTMILIYNIWTGFTGNILLFCGAMARVPMEVLESSKLEGCGAFREFVQIIIPLIFPTLSTQIILLFTGVFTSSGPILLFDPNCSYNTVTLSYWIFKQVYGFGTVGGSGSYNLVSATGLCFTLLGVPIILFVRWVMDRIPVAEY